MTQSLRAAFHRWCRDENGTTAIEYGLIAALVAVVCIGAFHSLGQTLAMLFGDIADALERVNGRIR
jgi:pilus assembly protein Flp/PilA